MIVPCLCLSARVPLLQITIMNFQNINYFNFTIPNENVMDLLYRPFNYHMRVYLRVINFLSFQILGKNIREFNIKIYKIINSLDRVKCQTKESSPCFQPSKMLLRLKRRKKKYTIFPIRNLNIFRTGSCSLSPM